MLALLTASVLAAQPASLEGLAAIWSSGVLDLVSGTRRDVTSSFAALVSEPLTRPSDRATPLWLLASGLPAEVRVVQPRFSHDTPALHAQCAKGEDDWTRFETVLEGTSHTWSLSFAARHRLAAGPPAQVPYFAFAALTPSGEGPKARIAALERERFTCVRVRRDGKGEVLLGKAKAAERFEAPRRAREAVASHPEALFEQAEAAVASLPSPEAFAARHRGLPGPRAAGVRSLLALADLLSPRRAPGAVALEAAAPDRAVAFFADAPATGTVLRLREGEYEAPATAPLREALPKPWSTYTWLRFDPRFPAGLVFEPAPASAACLDQLAVKPTLDLAELSGCLERALGDAGAPLPVRAERWLEPVQEVATLARARVAAFCEDQRALVGIDAFTSPAEGARRDAGPLLGAVLGWEQRGGKPLPGTLRLPTALEGKLAGTAFLELSDAEVAAAAHVDLSFFSRLAEFDRWELTTGGSPLSVDASQNAAEAPLPEFGRLVRAAQLLLRRALKASTLPDAAAQVRHAARLAFTTETSVGQAMALNLLAMELAAFRWARAHERPTGRWVPVSDLALKAARRALRTAPVFMSPLVDDETFAQARACEQATRCAALTEVAAVTGGLEPLLREPWRRRLSRALQLVHHPPSGCSGALARHWASQEMLDVTAARRSRLHEVVSGALLAAAAQRAYLDELRRWYP